MAYAQSFHTANNIVDGNWHYVAATRDPVHNVAIYVDGASQALVADVANTIADDATNTGNFNIGYDNGSAYTRMRSSTKLEYPTLLGRPTGLLPNTRTKAIRHCFILWYGQLQAEPLRHQLFRCHPAA